MRRMWAGSFALVMLALNCSARADGPLAVPAVRDLEACEEAWGLAWRPSGPQLAYLCHRPGDREVLLQVVSLADGQPRTLGEMGRAPETWGKQMYKSEWFPPRLTWSEDGESLYVLKSENHRFELLQVAPDSGETVVVWSDEIPFDHRPRQLLLAPDGSVVVSFEYCTLSKGRELPSLPSLPLVIFVPSRRKALRSPHPYRRIFPDHRGGSLIATTPEQLWELDATGKRLRCLVDLGDWTDVRRVLFCSDGNQVILVTRPNIREHNAEWHLLEGDGSLRKIAEAPEGFASLTPMADGRFLWTETHVRYNGTGRFRGVIREGTMLHVARIAEDGLAVTPVAGVPMDLYYIVAVQPSPDRKRALVWVHPENPDKEARPEGSIFGPNPFCLALQESPRLLLVEDQGGKLVGRLLPEAVSAHCYAPLAAWSPSGEQVALVSGQPQTRFSRVAYTRDNVEFLLRGTVRLLSFRSGGD